MKSAYEGLCNVNIVPEIQPAVACCSDGNHCFDAVDRGFSSMAVGLSYIASIAHFNGSALIERVRRHCGIGAAQVILLLIDD
jgi:hypothetical protein